MGKWFKKAALSVLVIFSLFVGLTGNYDVVVQAKTKTGISVRLKIGNQTVSGKTISVKKGKRKNIKVTIPKRKKYKITFRSNKCSIATVSKTGKITAKKIGTAKITVIAKLKKKNYKSWVKVKVVSEDKKSDAPLPAKDPIPSQTVTPSYAPTAAPPDTATVVPSVTPMVVPSETPSVMPSVTSTTTPTESSAPDTSTILDMYEVTLQVNGKVFSAKLYQTETTKSIMQKLPLSIMMEELNGNEKYYYFSESFKAEPRKVSWINAGDLKLYGSSCLVLFYESFSTLYSYTSLGYVENPEELAEALGTGSVRVDIFGSE